MLVPELPDGVRAGRSVEVEYAFEERITAAGAIDHDEVAAVAAVSP